MKMIRGYQRLDSQLASGEVRVKAVRVDKHEQASLSDSFTFPPFWDVLFLVYQYGSITLMRALQTRCFV